MAAIGYHGCDRAVAERLASGEPFAVSRKPWDWLGDGAYFWLDGPERAFNWSVRLGHAEPTVVSAELDLSLCLDLTRPAHQKLVSGAYERLQRAAFMAGATLQANTNLKDDVFRDRKLRNLDRLVLNALCDEVSEAATTALAAGRAPILPPFTAVRGVFQEGGAVYPGAGFHTHSHVQVAIRDQHLISDVAIVTF